MRCALFLPVDWPQRSSTYQAVKVASLPLRRRASPSSGRQTVRSSARALAWLRPVRGNVRCQTHVHRPTERWPSRGDSSPTGSRVGFGTIAGVTKSSANFRRLVRMEFSTRFSERPTRRF